MGQSFPQHERRLLLVTPGIGETVVQRLEAAGFASLQALCDAGAAAVAQQVRAQVGQAAWLNRRGAIERAIAQARGCARGGRQRREDFDMTHPHGAVPAARVRGACASDPART